MSKKRIRVIGLFIAVLSLAVLSGCGSAKKKQKATTKTTEVASTTEKENISKNKDQQTITSSATTEATTKVTTSTTTSTAKKTTKATTETPIATKKDEQKAAVKATVTYNGFSDTNSVEMKMSDGSYEVCNPREIFIRLLLCGASTFVMIHNHPSGDTNPSKADRMVAQKLKEAGDLLGITMIDSIIIGYHYYLSMKENSNAKLLNRMSI